MLMMHVATNSTKLQSSQLWCRFKVGVKIRLGFARMQPTNTEAMMMGTSHATARAPPMTIGLPHILLSGSAPGTSCAVQCTHLSTNV